MPSILLSGLKSFGRMLGVSSSDKTEALLHSEAAARSLLSRRAFIGASAALTATAVAYSLPRRTFVGSRGHLYLGLHTEEPGAFGAHEADFTGYGRVEVARTAENWEVSEGVVRNARPIEFPQCVGGREVVTYLSLRDHLGRVMISGPLNESLELKPGCATKIAPGGLYVDPFSPGDDIECRLIPPAPGS